jgi:CheY-like chemotaxis protein
MMILVADDNEEYRDMLCGSLLAAGHEVITAPDGDAAFQLLQIHEVDLIISDVQMPHCTGIEFHDHVREDKRFRELPFVYLTGYVETRVVLQRESERIDFVECKVPISPLMNIVASFTHV